MQVAKSLCYTGAVLLSGGVDMLTLRAASGDGASMHAPSPLDVVAHLSLQVGVPALPCHALPFPSLCGPAPPCPVLPGPVLPCPALLVTM